MPTSPRALLLAAALALPAVAQTPLSAQFDSIFAPLTTTKSPGLAVLVRYEGRTVYQRAFGVRDLRTLPPNDELTNFRLASFTKQFTAMSVMLLVHDGKLRYDQPLSEVLPGFPPYARTITLRHLLTHTSGIADYEDFTPPELWSPQHQIQDNDVLSVLQRQPAPQFSPGTSWSYSNSAYVLLGLIVARASGEPFGQFLEHRIFKPLQMTHTLAYRKGFNTVPRRAFGHSKKDGTFVETDQSSTSATLGDGGIYSNLVDLAKWDTALQNYTLLSRSEMEPALTPVTLSTGEETHWPAAPGDDNLHPGKPVAYGFGWFLDSYRGYPRMGHTGSTQGFRTAIQRFPADRLTVILLANRTDLDTAALSLQAADLFLK